MISLEYTHNDVTVHIQESSDPDAWELVELFARFMAAMGYGPVSIAAAFHAYDAGQSPQAKKE